MEKKPKNSLNMVKLIISFVFIYCINVVLLLSSSAIVDIIVFTVKINFNCFFLNSGKIYYFIYLYSVVLLYYYYYYYCVLFYFSMSAIVNVICFYSKYQF